MRPPGVRTLGPRAARLLPERLLLSGECVTCLLARGSLIASVGRKTA